MRIDKTITRAMALFKWFENDYPNFDGEIPDDEFYIRFRKMTDGLTFASFNYFKSDIAMLGLIRREGRFNKLNSEKIPNYKKRLLKIEKEEIERLYNKIKE